MFTSLPQEVDTELEQLAQSYGSPLVRTLDLAGSTLFDPLSSTDRYGEVCMVVRRLNGKLITMTKTFYPEGAYRLPTGGIHHGERVLDALLRETHEETGLQVTVERFLSAIAYRPAGSDTPVFYTFSFLLDEAGGELGAIDITERVEAFLEIEPAELVTVARVLEQLAAVKSDELHGDWSTWGCFRALNHYIVWEALSTK